MIRLLFERESGLLSPMVLKRAEAARRNFDLELSKHKDMKGCLKGSVNSLDLDSAETRYLLCGCTDSTIAIFDVLNQNRNPKQTYPQVCSTMHNRGSQKHSVETVQWYPVDTGMFTSSGGDCQLKIWDTNCLKLADKFLFEGLVYSHHMSGIACKHCLIAVACHRSSVKLVDIKSGSAAHQLKGHVGSVYAVQWSSRDEFLLATGSADKKVMLWDIRQSKGCLMSLDQHNSSHSTNSKERVAHDGTVNAISFTQDGLHLVTFGSDCQLRLWDTAMGQNKMMNYGHVPNKVKKSLKMAICSSSHPQVLFVPSDNSIEMFDLFKGSNLSKLRGHFNVVNCCVSQPDSQYLFSGGADRNILVWTPGSETEDFEDYLRLINKYSGAGKIGKSKELATADTWSSDEG